MTRKKEKFHFVRVVRVNSQSNTVTRSSDLRYLFDVLFLRRRGSRESGYLVGFPFFDSFQKLSFNGRGYSRLYVFSLQGLVYHEAGFVKRDKALTTMEGIDSFYL